MPSTACFPKLAEVFNCSIELIWIPPKAVYTPKTKKPLTEEEQAIRTANQKKAAPYIARRQKLGLFQRELAEKAGVNESIVFRMESGKNWPRWETRQKLRRALGMPEERSYTVEERNEIFLELEKQGVIRMAMTVKREKLKAAHVDFNDLYQELAMQALRAIDRFQPGDATATLKTFVRRNLEFYIEKWIAKTCMHGFSGEVSHPRPDIRMFSLDALMEAGFDPIG